MAFEDDIKNILNARKKSANDTGNLMDRIHGALSNVLFRIQKSGIPIFLDRLDNEPVHSWNVRIEEVTFSIHGAEVLKLLAEDPDADLGHFFENLIKTRLKEA